MRYDDTLVEGNVRVCFFTVELLSLDQLGWWISDSYHTHANRQQLFYHSLPEVEASGPLPEGIRLMSPNRFTSSSVYMLSASHSHTEGLTFQRVFVKSAPTHVTLPEDGGDFSDNGPLAPIDSICGAKGQWNKGPGLQHQISDWLIQIHPQIPTIGQSGEHQWFNASLLMLIKDL